MKVEHFHDDGIEQIARANADAFFSDLAADPQQIELAKASRDNREFENVNHFFEGFEEDMRLAACGARSGPSPRLRSERPESESDWRPGDPIDKGLTEDDGGPLEKRYQGKLTKKVSASGWTSEFNEKGEIVRAYGPGVDLS